MSRLEYHDCYDVDDMLRSYAFEHNARRAAEGKKGQAVLRELRDALRALPHKRLIAGDWLDVETGDVCALGALAKARGVAASEMPDEYEDGAEAARDLLGIVYPLAFTIIEANDEARVTPEQRYELVLEWVERRIMCFDG